MIPVSKNIRHFVISLSYLRKTLREVGVGERIVLIVTADELRKRMGQWQSQKEEMPNSLPSPPTNNPWEIFKVTFDICPDC